MKYLSSFQLFERKGNYQLFHKTSRSAILSILNDGYIKADPDAIWQKSELRKNVLDKWKKNDKKFLTISATRNLNYFGLPALELDVEKISDNYKIIPYSENPDFYLDFKENRLKPRSNPFFNTKGKLTKFQNQIRSKSKGAGKLFWRTKTDKNAFDFDIAEELILTSKLDVGKYVKRIILHEDEKEIIDLIKTKYSHIEIIIIPKYRNLGYIDIKSYIQKKSKELKSQKIFNEV